MRRGQVFQIGPVIPNIGWEKQPPLVYATSATTAIDRRGYDYLITNRASWESRGTIREVDLQKIERKAERRAARRRAAR